MAIMLSNQQNITKAARDNVAKAVPIGHHSPPETASSTQLAARYLPTVSSCNVRRNGVDGLQTPDVKHISLHRQLTHRFVAKPKHAELHFTATLVVTNLPFEKRVTLEQSASLLSQSHRLFQIVFQRMQVGGVVFPNEDW